MFVGVVGRPRGRLGRTDHQWRLVNGYSPWKLRLAAKKKDSDEDVGKREWESGLDTPLGLRHPHSHITHSVHDAGVYMT